MVDKKPPRAPVVQLPVGSVLGPMMERIRTLAKETVKVFFSEHAEARMWDRDISSIEVLEALRLGSIDGVPWTEPETSEQACKIVFKKKGSRTVGVVTILLAEDGLFVKTVEWED